MGPHLNDAVQADSPLEPDPRAASPRPGRDASHGGQAPAGRPALVLGVLGGIASGKSEVARLLAGDEGLVIDADRLAHEVLASSEVTELVREAFGDDTIGSDGRPDRRVLAGRVFVGASGAEARRKLEGWIHPRVRARILARLSEAQKAGAPVIVLDIPLLLENDAQHGLVDRCHRLIFVDVDPRVRAERATRTRGWSADELAQREAAQLPLEVKKRRADHVIPNHGTPDELRSSVTELLRELQRR